MRGAVLAGIRVVDFTWVGVGPFATKFLADLGADVIKVESASRIDAVRMMRPAAGGRAGVNRSGYFANRNSSKRSIALDLKHPNGLRLARELVRGGDVVINNFSPGTLARIGLSYRVAQGLNPSVVYVDMPMQGVSGPHARFRGYGAMVNALSGLYALTGLPDRRPVGPGTNYPDHVPNPLHATIAVLAALWVRERTGRGTYIEVSQLESTLNVLGPWLMLCLNGEPDPHPVGNHHGDHVPQGVYRCRDGWCAITVRTVEHWRGLADAIGCDDWGDSDELTTPEARRDIEGEIDRRISSWTSERTGVEAMSVLQARGVPAGKVQDAREVLDDPQLIWRGHWVRLRHPEMGVSVYDGPVARLSLTPAHLSSPAPMLGQHTREVCLEVLGMDTEEFDKMHADGVFT